MSFFLRYSNRFLLLPTILTKDLSVLKSKDAQNQYFISNGIQIPDYKLFKDKETFLHESNGNPGKYCYSEFSYNSQTNTNFLTVKEIKELIIK